MKKTKKIIIDKILNPQTPEDYSLGVNLNDREMKEFTLITRDEQGGIVYPERKVVNTELKKDKMFNKIIEQMSDNVADTLSRKKKALTPATASCAYKATNE